MKKRILILLLFTTILLTPIACKHNVNTTPVTPFQQVVITNTGLAQTNENIAKAIIALNNQNPPLIDKQSAKSILTAQSKIALADKKLTAILVQGPEYATGQAAQIQELVDDITGSATELVNSGTVGIKNPDEQKKVSGFIITINSLAHGIIPGLKLAGVLK